MKKRLLLGIALVGAMGGIGEIKGQDISGSSSSGKTTAGDSVKNVTPTSIRDSVALKEVVVKAARVIDKVDGQLIFPSEVQKQHSHSGFSLLNKLALPNIRVDELSHAISAIDQRGTVQVRINGIIANMRDVQALDVSSVSRIDYIDSPGVRYGKDIAYVIDIRSRHQEVGGTVGGDLTNALTNKRGVNEVFAAVNRGNSQFRLFYEQNYFDYRANDYRENAQYQLADGSVCQMSRQRKSGRVKDFGNTVELKYSLADSASYVFQTSFSTAFDNRPRTSGETWVSDNSSEYMAHDNDKSRSFTPSLDIYFYHQLGKHQSFTADLLATYIGTRSDSYDDEGTPYSYQVDGKTCSLIAEAIYENRLKSLTFSAGVNVNWKYMSNCYMGDVESQNGIHTSGIYGFSEIKGKWAKLNYVAGIGLSNQRYRQATDSYSYWLVRPKFTLSYPLSSAHRLRYIFELSQHISQVAIISDTRVRQNSMEWTVGNPALRPSSRYEFFLAWDYSKPRLHNILGVDYRINRNCNMAKYARTDDNQFLYMQANQPHCNMLYVRDDCSIELIPDHLTLTPNAGIYRFFNKGDDYNHFYTSYNYGAYLQGYWGNWSFMLNADNGWNFMEGEMIGHQGAALNASVGYRLGDFDFTLYVQNPFLAHPKIDSSEVVNALVKKQMSIHSLTSGNMVQLSVAWRINRGHKYHDIRRSIKNRERETGIMK